MVDVPVVLVVQAPQLHVETAEIPQLQVVVHSSLYGGGGEDEGFRPFYGPFSQLRPLGRRVPGGGDAGSLLPGVLPPELGAIVMGHRQRSLINILSVPPPPPPPPSPPHPPHPTPPHPTPPHPSPPPPPSSPPLPPPPLLPPPTTPPPPPLGSDRFALSSVFCVTNNG